MEYFNTVIVSIILIYLFLLLFLLSFLFFIPESSQFLTKKWGEKAMLQSMLILVLFAILGLSIISVSNNKSILNLLWIPAITLIVYFLIINKNIDTYKMLKSGDRIDLMKLFRLLNQNYHLEGNALTFCKYALQLPTYFYDKKINWLEQINGKDVSYRPILFLHVLLHEYKVTADLNAKEFEQYTSKYFKNLTPSSQVFYDFRKSTQYLKKEEINKTIYNIFIESITNKKIIDDMS